MLGISWYGVAANHPIIAVKEMVDDCKRYILQPSSRRLAGLQVIENMKGTGVGEPLW